MAHPVLTMEHTEELREDAEAFPGFFAPSNTIVSGVSGSGKTSLVFRMLRQADRLYQRPVEKILYCMAVDQPLYAEMRARLPGIEFHEGLPDADKLKEFGGEASTHRLVVLDDLMQEVVKSVTMQKLFTQISHHLCISVVFLTQNMFAQGTCARNVSLNAHYFVVMCNPRDVQQVNRLASQTGLDDTLKSSYKDCVGGKKYGYQVVLLHPSHVATARDSARLRARIHTDIFPGENLISYL